MEKISSFEIPRGKLSYVILSTLKSGDKYGYEIIESISKLTNGELNIKQPSLYSSLKRMEDQDLISSYWMDSDIGGRRHYYRLKDLGRKQLEKWDNEFELDSPSPTLSQNQPKSSETFLQQENLFDINNEQSSIETEKNEIKPFEDDAVLLTKEDAFVQYNLFDQPQTHLTQSNFSNSNTNIAQEAKQDIIDQSQKDEQNTNVKIESVNVVKSEEIEQINNDFDIFAELEQYRKNGTSFADQNIKKTNNSDYHNNTLEDFMGDSFVMQKLDNSFIAEEINSYSTLEEETNLNNEQNQNESELNNISLYNVDSSEDAKLITEHYTEEDMPKVRKIAPTEIDVFSTTQTCSPSSFDRQYTHQTYDEKIVNLYEKNTNIKVNDTENITPPSISNYTNLKKYFDDQKITFNTYSKNITEITQTSLVSEFKFSLIRYSMTFVSLLIFLLATLFTIRACAYVSNGALALYIVPLILYVLFAGFKLIEKSKHKDRKILLMETNKLHTTIKIALSIFACLLIYIFNVIGGLHSGNFADYANTLIAPIIVIIHIPLTSVYSFLTSKINWIK